MKRLWKVGELAKLTGLTIRTLRFYDQIGLFSPSAHSDSGHRLYNEADLSRLQQILSLKELGLSLEEIKSVVTGGHFSPLEIVSLQITRLKETIRMQQKLLSEGLPVDRCLPSMPGTTTLCRTNASFIPILWIWARRVFPFPRRPSSSSRKAEAQK
ncbi:MerR family transcriptional regulator [Paenibacillus tyrfis]|uniref:MerR family transcriptional regulator n=1 Tax=Paenibacillus tyrfis TaxID=1501230 RepID=UPI0039B72F20